MMAPIASVSVTIRTPTDWITRQQLNARRTLSDHPAGGSPLLSVFGPRCRAMRRSRSPVANIGHLYSE